MAAWRTLLTTKHVWISTIVRLFAPDSSLHRYTISTSFLSPMSLFVFNFSCSWRNRTGTEGTRTSSLLLPCGILLSKILESCLRSLMPSDGLVGPTPEGAPAEASVHTAGQKPRVLGNFKRHSTSSAIVRVAVLHDLVPVNEVRHTAGPLRYTVHRHSAHFPFGRHIVGRPLCRQARTAPIPPLSATTLEAAVLSRCQCKAQYYSKHAHG